MSRPLRVALLVTSIDFGGIERVLLTLLENVDASVEVYPIVFTRTDARDRTFFDRLTALGIEHSTLYVNTNRMKYLNPVRNIPETIAIFREKQFDLIHSHGYRADMLGLVLAKCFRLPLVTTCHGFIPLDERVRLYNRLNIFILRFFTRVIAVSALMKQELVAQGVGASKIDVITNAVEEVAESDVQRSRVDIRTRLGIADQEFVFGFVGRLSSEKGVDYLVQAVDALAARDRTLRLLLVGDGPNRKVLEDMVDRLGLRAQVTFAGFQRNPSEFYAAMDAFVLPSLTEGTPMALLEAMAHGLPVIATSVGGVPSVVADRQNGLLVAPSDTGQLANAMRAVSTDPALCRALSGGALRAVRERYDVRNWIGKIADAYLSAVDQRRAQWSF